MTAKPWTPRRYQPMMMSHMLDVPRCGLWAGMGLGKTVTTFSALDALYIAGAETGPSLVLAPKRVAATTWPEEATKWSHLRHIEVHAIVGEAAQRGEALRKALRVGNASLFTMNYENLPWLSEQLAALKQPWPFRTVVSDESTRLKSMRPSMQRRKDGTEYVRASGGIRARELAKIAHTQISRFIQLSGTPSPNGLQDLWGQVWFLDAGLRLGRTFEGFKQRWFQKAHNGYGIDPLPFAQEQIQKRLKDICLSVDPKDWFDLREPIVNNIYVDLPDSARALYKQMERDMFAEIEGHPVEAFNAASRTIKCLQLANGAAYVDDKATQWREVHDVKLQALESIIEEAAGAPVLVAYHFRSDLERLQRAFPKGRLLDADPKTIRDWNAGRIPLLFAHPASAGHGLNLQDGGNILAFFGHWWNLEERLQIIERIGPVRQMQAGHDRPVFIHNIIARGTVDELVIARVESKRSVQDLLLDAMKGGRHV